MDKTLVDPDLPNGGHLPPERLAALADESPSAVEAHHLVSCPICAEEVAAYQALLTLTRGERDRLGEPLTNWAALSAALAEDEILDAGTPLQAPARRRARLSMLKPLTQAAAAALILASGVAIGRLTVRSMPLQGSFASRTGQKSAISEASQASNTTSARLISDTMTFVSRGQALDALEQAEARYRHAVAYLMESDSSALTEGPEGYRTRLAALEQVERTTRAALVAAPDDPVLNQWYISTVGAQQATVRQLVQARPLSKSPHRY
jgi:hypothetical protein